MKTKFLLGGLLLSMTFKCLPLCAANIPVAEGYPDWQGVVDKNYVTGRMICPSDLRQKVTIVLEIENCANLSNLLVQAGGLTHQARTPYGYTWEQGGLQRNAIFLVSVRNKKDTATIIDTIKKLGKAGTEWDLAGIYLNWEVPFYENVTFVGGPDTAGKRPYFYVLGPGGSTILSQGTVSEKSVKEAVAVIQKELAKLKNAETPWIPFFGSVPEPKYFPQVAKTLDEGKPLPPLEKALLKEVQSKDPEKAKEAQILYDALNQTRSDLIQRVIMESSTAPHVAYSDIQKVLKYWASEKKRFEDVLKRIEADPDMKKMAKIFAQVLVWEDPKFTCKNAGEAKKIVAELKKMKKILDKIGDSENVFVQNAAALTGAKIDELVDLIPTKVAGK